MRPHPTDMHRKPIQDLHPMTSSHPWAALGLAALLLGATCPAIAGEGHDHGDAAPAILSSLEGHA